jgi:bifunctional enzyme CysN/CysC
MAESIQFRADTNGDSPLRDNATSDLLRFATAGSVDDGKSTLIGRLLYDSKAVLRDQMEAVERTSRERGDGYVDLALLTDGLRAEREQGITIDVAYRYFATARRRFIIADTPGHVRYTRNMVTGASTANLALILIDARNGVVEQSRRHAFIASLLGIPHLVVCVNKMDLVDYDQAVFDRIEDEFRSFEAKLDVRDVTFIPISALNGDNVVERSENMPWYQGPPLLYHLEHVHIASDRNLEDQRFPVQWVIRPQSTEHHDYRGYAGQVASGTFRPGDEVVILPAGHRTKITSVDTLDGPLDAAEPPLSVALRLEDDLDISRGDMIVGPHEGPTVTRSLEATLCWMSERPLKPGQRLHIKHTTRSARATIQAIHDRTDVDTLERVPAESLELNDIGHITLSTSAPLMVDTYRRNRTTGSFILIDPDTNDTVGAGMVLEPTVEGSVRSIGHTAAAVGHSPGVVWDEATLTREERWSALHTRGATVWLTGLPASGKSTIARALEVRLVELGHPAYRLDGDNLRHGLNGDLGFDAASRDENIRRTAHVAHLLADSGQVAIASLVSPFIASREHARRIHAEDDDLPFLEIYVDTPLQVCERRDPKGLYAKARAGELKGMTGVDDPYEPPPSPELVIDGSQPVETAVEQILALLRERGVL